MTTGENNQQDNIKQVIEELSRESEQEKAAKQGTESYLGDANADQLIGREREYRDPEKHWVRNQWLQCAKEVANANGRKIKYLTLPAYYRIDVSLFSKHDLLARSSGPAETLAVAAFETDPTKFARMSSHLPRLQLFGQGPLEDAIVDFKNKYYPELAAMFPFDILNFDLTTSLTPRHEGPYSQVMNALSEALRRQADHTGLWALFLTFRNVKDEWEQTALHEFLRNLQQNLDQHPKVRDTFANRYQTSSVTVLEKDKAEAAVTQSVIKWLVDRAHAHSIALVSVNSYHYTRNVKTQPHYVITKLIMQFRRGVVSKHAIPMKTTPRQGWMDDDLAKCISQNKHRDVVEILRLSPEGTIDRLHEEVEQLVRGFDEPSRISL